MQKHVCIKRKEHSLYDYVKFRKISYSLVTENRSLCGFGRGRERLQRGMRENFPVLHLLSSL